MTNVDIMALLAEHGFASAEVKATDGGSILVMSAATRVLRLTGKSGHDFLWLNDAFRGGDPQGLFGSPGWLNFGGDRTWVSPEADIFISDLSDPWATYKMPEVFDPGAFEVHSLGSFASVAGRFTVTNFRFGGQAELALEKTVRAVPSPLRHLKEADAYSQVEYVGCEQETMLELLSEPSLGLRFGLWHLAQVRSVGDILIPTVGPDRPRDYLAATGTSHLTVAPGLVRFRVDAAEQHKIGIKATSLTGRSGFMREDEDGMWSLLVRNFIVNPSGEYVDVPWDDLSDEGYAMQCYNDDGNFADFGEMEYHAPAIGYGTGLTSYTDRSQLWAFRADKPVIEQIARRLLGMGEAQ